MKIKRTPRRVQIRQEFTEEKWKRSYFGLGGSSEKMNMNLSSNMDLELDVWTGIQGGRGEVINDYRGLKFYFVPLRSEFIFPAP